MNRIVYAFLFLLLILVVSGFLSAQQFNIAEKHFKIVIEQEGRIVEPEGETVMLKKAPFIINVLLKQEGGIYVNISDNPLTYVYAKSGRSMASILEVDGRWMGGAEYLRNEKNDFFLQSNETSWQYWYYYREDGEEHRFNQVADMGDYLSCTRIIENYYDGEEHAIDELPYNEIYLVFAMVTHDDNYENFTEAHKSFFRIKFIK